MWLFLIVSCTIRWYKRFNDSIVENNENKFHNWIRSRWIATKEWDKTEIITLKVLKPGS